MIVKGADFNFGSFWNSQEQKIFNFITCPLETSLNRFKQKLLFNAIENLQAGYMQIFTTLTVDEEHYGDVFLEKSGSAFIRKWLTKVRNWFKRHELAFEYAWRIERGGKNTKRLHYHALFAVQGINKRDFQEIIMGYWKYCKWDKLDADRCFEELSTTNLASIYVSKYCSKKINVDSESPTQLRNELHGRINSTSRGFQRKPKCFFMQFNWETKCWTTKLKSNWYLMSQQFIDKLKTPVVEKFYDQDDNICFSDSRTYLDQAFESGALEWKKNFEMYGGQWYYNKFPFTKITIASFKHYSLASNDFIKDFKAFQQEDKELIINDEDQASLQLQYENVCNFYSYDMEIKEKRHEKVHKKMRSVWKNTLGLDRYRRSSAGYLQFSTSQQLIYEVVKDER